MDYLDKSEFDDFLSEQRGVMEDEEIEQVVVKEEDPTEEHIEMPNNGKSCSFCAKRFSSVKDRKTHEDSVHRQIRYQCPLCDKQFSRRSKTKQHLKQNHETEGEEARSKKIEEIFPGSPRYKPHFDRGDFECDQCSRKLSSSTHLKRHKQAVHGETFEKIIHGSKECEICGKVFAAPKDKRKHVEAVHQGLRYECPFCLKQQSSRNSLISHIRRKHDQTADQIQQLTLKQIDPATKNSTNRKRKERDSPEFECDLCDSSFHSNFARQKHYLAFHAEAGNAEQVTFTVIGEHSDFETDEPKLISYSTSSRCEYCLKPFYTSTDKRKHVDLVHLNIRYECGLCKGRFGHKRAFPVHAKKHPEESELIFKKVQIPKSEKAADEEMTINCQECPIRFSSEDEKREHILETHLNEIFSCSICAAQFPNGLRLQYHLKRVHHQNNPEKIPKLSKG